MPDHCQRGSPTGDGRYRGLLPGERVIFLREIDQLRRRMFEDPIGRVLFPREHTVIAGGNALGPRPHDRHILNAEKNPV